MADKDFIKDLVSSWSIVSDRKWQYSSGPSTVSQKRKTKIADQIPIFNIVQKRKTKKGNDNLKSVVQSCGETKHEIDV